MCHRSHVHTGTSHEEYRHICTFSQQAGSIESDQSQACQLLSETRNKYMVDQQNMLQTKPGTRLSHNQTSCQAAAHHGIAEHCNTRQFSSLLECVWKSACHFKSFPVDWPAVLHQCICPHTLCQCLRRHFPDCFQAFKPIASPCDFVCRPRPALCSLTVRQLLLHITASKQYKGFLTSCFLSDCGSTHSKWIAFWPGEDEGW